MPHGCEPADLPEVAVVDRGVQEGHEAVGERIGQRNPENFGDATPTPEVDNPAEIGESDRLWIRTSEEAADVSAGTPSCLGGDLSRHGSECATTVGVSGDVTSGKDPTTAGQPTGCIDHQAAVFRLTEGTAMRLEAAGKDDGAGQRMPFGALDRAVEHDTVARDLGDSAVQPQCDAPLIEDRRRPMTQCRGEASQEPAGRLDDGHSKIGPVVGGGTCKLGSRGPAADDDQMIREFDSVANFERIGGGAKGQCVIESSDGGAHGRSTRGDDHGIGVDAATVSQFDRHHVLGFMESNDRRLLDLSGRNQVGERSCGIRAGLGSSGDSSQTSEKWVVTGRLGDRDSRDRG